MTNQPPSRPAARGLLTALLAVASVASAGCANDRSVIAQATNTHKQLQPAVMQDEALANYLQQVGERIIDSAQALDREHVGPKAHFSENDEWMFSNRMKFHFVNSKTLNAFTTGGEHMYIYNELFQKCRSEDELAAVMAHEFAHVYCRHVASGTNRQLPLLVGGALAGGAAGYALGGSEHGTEYAAAGAGVGAAGGQFANMGFTRTDESQADEYGFRFYTEAGWDPDHFGDFFKDMVKMGYDKTPAILSDHPSLASRATIADDRAKKLGTSAERFRKPPVANASKFKDLQTRAARLGKTLPDDTTLKGSQQLLQALPRSCVASDPNPPDAQAARQELVKANNAAQTKRKKAAQGG